MNPRVAVAVLAGALAGGASSWGCRSADPVPAPGGQAPSTTVPESAATPDRAASNGPPAPDGVPPAGTATTPASPAVAPSQVGTPATGGTSALAGAVPGGPPPGGSSGTPAPGDCVSFCDSLADRAETCLADSGRSWGAEAAAAGGESMSSREEFVLGCRGQLVSDMDAASCASSARALAEGRLGCAFIAPRLFGDKLPSGGPGAR